MWEYLFLFTTVILAIIFTFPKKSAIRRVITTTPILLKNIIKTKSITPHLKSFVQKASDHKHRGNCCSQVRKSDTGADFYYFFWEKFTFLVKITSRNLDFSAKIQNFPAENRNFDLKS